MLFESVGHSGIRLGKGLRAKDGPLQKSQHTDFNQLFDVRNWLRMVRNQEGKWTQLKGKAREQWGTDDDLERAKGNREQLAGRIQERYGTAKEEAERQVDEWSRRMD